MPAAGRARARVTERRCHRVIAVGLTPSSRACVVDQDVSSAAWWSTEARGGTETEVLSLALLVAARAALEGSGFAVCRVPLIFA